MLIKKITLPKELTYEQFYELVGIIEDYNKEGIQKNLIYDKGTSQIHLEWYLYEKDYYTNLAVYRVYINFSHLSSGVNEMFISIHMKKNLQKES